MTNAQDPTTSVDRVAAAARHAVAAGPLAEMLGAEGPACGPDGCTPTADAARSPAAEEATPSSSD